MSTLPAPFSAHLPVTAPSGPVQPQTQHRRLAALGLVGGLMVALPLVQVLRYQGAEIAGLMSEQAALDPVARAVGTQRGFIEHRILSAQVLRGAADKEAARRQRQTEVDQRMTLLMRDLKSGVWERAATETGAMNEDWLALVRQVSARSIDAGQSDEGHRLLIEEVLQVIDLVTDETAVHAAGGSPLSQAVLATALNLPRVTAHLAALSANGSAPRAERRHAGFQRELADAEAALARTLRTLDHALANPKGSDAGVDDRTAAAARHQLAQASAVAGARARQWLELLHSPSAAGGPVEGTAEERAAADAALQAQWALFDQAHGSASADFGSRIGRLERHREWLLDAMTGLGIVAALLLASLLRSPRPNPAPITPSPTSGVSGERRAPAPRSSRDEAIRVLQRLRMSGRRASGSEQEPARRDDQPTLPPEP